MQIEMKYFGMIAEQTGIASETMNLSEEISLKELKNNLLEKYSGLEKIHFSFAVNMELNSDFNYVISSDCEIAILPAFAGG